MAPRVEDDVAKNADWTKIRTRISAALRIPSSVWASSASVTTQVPSEDQR